MRLVKWALCSLVFFSSLVQPSIGENLATSGHLKFQGGVTHLDSDGPLALLGPDDPWQGSFDTRINLEKNIENFEASVHTEVLGIGGDGLESRRKLAVQSIGGDRSLPNDRNKVMDLTVDLEESEDFESVARVDRLGIGYSSDLFLAKIGRQAISWGNGLGFQVFDFFSPFSPIAIDKDYKPGEDMVTTQLQLKDGGDIQAAIVPRRGRESHDFTMGQSNGSIKYRNQIYDVTYEILSGKRLNNFVVGGGVNRNLWEGVVRSDLLFTERGSQENTVDFLLNYDRSWEIGGKNVYSYFEYFHNALGAKDIDLFSIDERLQKQISLGESYVLGKDYINLGFRVELTPLVNLYPSSIFNLHEPGGLAQMRLVYDVMQDVALTFGGNLPYGGDGEYEELGKEMYVRVALYM